MKDSSNISFNQENDKQIWINFYDQLSAAQKEAVLKASEPEGFEAVYPVTTVVEEYLNTRGDTYPTFGYFEVEASERAEDIKQRLSFMVKNSQTLRSVVAVPEEGRPVQVVLKAPRTSFFQADLRKLSDGNKISDRQRAYFTSLCRMEISKNTELGKKIILRVGLIRLTDTKSILYVAFSHLVLDGVGFALLVADLLGKRKGRNDRDLWHYYLRKMLESDREQAWSYWRQLLGDSLKVTSLPDCGSGNEDTDFRMFYAAMGQPLKNETVRFCEHNHVTLAVLMHYVLGKALMDVLAADEVRFLTIGSGRDKQISNLLGMLMAFFPVRVQKEDSVFDLQEQIHNSVKHSWVWNLPDQISLDQLGQGMLALDIVDFTLPGEDFCRYREPQYLTKGIQADEMMVSFPKRKYISFNLMAHIYGNLIFIGMYDANQHSSAFMGKLRSALVRSLRETVHEPEG